MKFSVIVAARNEGSQIAAALKRLRHISQTSPMELFVVDGGSDDATAEIARDWADEVLEVPTPDRGPLWNAGAAKATGELLFFLRADAHPPDQWQQVLERYWLATPVEQAAATAFSVDYGAGGSMRALSAWSNARARRGVVTADHGLCTTPETFKAAGGFPEGPLEDYGFSRRLAARGRVALLPERIRPAARRIHADGALRYALGRVWGELSYR